MEKFFKNALLTGTAILGFGMAENKLSAQTPGDKAKAPSSQEDIKPRLMSEREASLRADLEEFMKDPIGNEATIEDIENQLKEFDSPDDVNKKDGATSEEIPQITF